MHWRHGSGSMSSFDKTVKLACKPKAAPPKAKYIDPIIAATYSEDGAVHDVCRALSLRLREPNTIIVFKALIVLHTMIRNGATDNVLSYLASDDVLRLKGVSAGHWDGYDTPKNLQNYAIYLDMRIRTYKDLKHDPVRVQSESNRDARVENTLERSGTVRASNSNGPQRSKTIMGRKLRSMTVEKGLLRETKAVQRTINALVECRFYYDNLEDDLNVTALRMLVKDLLILFQAVNEGVINVLEHYFEMSHVDAETALNIYRNFCKQTEKVVEYLGIARKLQNLLNVPVPNLKHAPVSLVTALEEYLNDPNFEQNRIEYKTTKALADKNEREDKKAPSNGAANKEKPASNGVSAPASSNAEVTLSSSDPPKSENKALVDFFSSIEEEQTSMFASQANGHLHQAQQQQQMQHQAIHNPFAMRQSMIITGGLPQQQTMPFGQPQPSGLMPPQSTGFPGMPFQQPQPTGFSQGQHPSFSSFLRPHSTAFLQPQATGANPFRQSMLMPGMPAFGTPAGSHGAGFQSPNSPFSVQHPTGQPNSMPSNAFGPMPMQSVISSPPSTTNIANTQQLPQRPASTPLTNTNNAFETVKSVVSHQTGSRNPFGVPQEPAPPVPKPPTLQELASGHFNRGAVQQTASPQPSQQSAPCGSTVSQAPSTSSGDAASMAGVASSFSFNKNWSVEANKPASDTPSLPSLTSQFTSTSAFSSQPTGTTNASSAFSGFAGSSSPPLRPQTTGFAGIKPFKPTSSFGASLLESLPPIPEPSSTSEKPATYPTTGSGMNSGSLSSTSSASQPFSTSTLNGPTTFGAPGSSSTPTSSTATGFGPSSGLGALNAQPIGFGGSGGGGSTFGSNLGVGLRPQMTGSSVANPFRASMINPSTSPLNGSTPPMPTSQFGSTFGTNPINTHSVGANLFRSSAGDLSNQQQNGVASLI